MPLEAHKILFAGQTLENVSQDVAKANLKKLLKADDATVERLFSGKSFAIKKELNQGQVEKYVSVLNKAGLEVQVEPPLGEDISLDVEELAADSAEVVTEAPKKSEAQAQNPYSAPAAQELQSEVHCRQCGSKIGASDPVCHKCGGKQLIGKPRSKVTAGLLAIFLGWLGVHRFYLGQWWGIFYFFFGLLAWPIAIIEGIVFLVTPQEKWDLKYSSVKNVSGVLIIIVAIVVFIAIVGILAAIAIPAYQDYTLRAKVASARVKVDETRNHLAHFMLSNNTIPNSNRDAGLPEEISGEHLSSIEVLPGAVMQVTFESTHPQLNNKTIVWVPEFDGNQVSWDCSGGTLSSQYRLADCRNGKYKGEQVPSNLTQFISADNSVEMIVPKTWKHEELGEDTTVQLANLFTEAYLIVYTEPKADLPDHDLSSFGNAVRDIIVSNLSNSKAQYLGSTPVNGKQALHYRIDGRIEDVDLTYLVSVVEGQVNFYQVITWSLASRFSRNEGDFKAVIASFKERNGS